MIPRFMPAVAAVVALAANAGAQSASPKNVLSVQPGVVLGITGVEYERVSGKANTFGFGVFRYSRGEGADEVTFSAAEVRLRYYPWQEALQGLSVGGAIGFSGVKGTSRTLVDQSKSAPSIGLMLEYQRQLGFISLAAGVGARAVFVGKDDITSPDFAARHATARVSIGVAW